MRAWAREPLLHFLVIGVAIFAAYRLLSDSDAPPREIVVSSSRVQALSDSFQKTWMRPPTAQELRGLVDDYVADEVYYREAIALGIDRDDTVIRRRLRQKMEFISVNVADALDPTDAQLEGYLRQNADKFITPVRFSFQQIFVSVDRGAAARDDAARILASLSAGGGKAAPDDLGDPTLLPTRLDGVSVQDVANAFGRSFAEQMGEAPIGEWSGPLRSGYGFHLIRVERVEPASLPTIDSIRPIVLREWQAAQNAQAKSALLSQLRAKYRVHVEGSAGKLLHPPADEVKR
jgi:hypothetical protein